MAPPEGLYLDKQSTDSEPEVHWEVRTTEVHEGNKWADINNKKNLKSLNGKFAATQLRAAAEDSKITACGTQKNMGMTATFHWNKRKAQLCFYCY